jgi:hypothetical protein
VALALIGAFIAFWLAATGYLGRTLLVLGLILLAIYYYDSIPWAWVTLGILVVIPILIGLLARPTRAAMAPFSGRPAT